MSFWDFIAKLGSPAKTSAFEETLEQIGRAADALAHSEPKENSLMDRLSAAERNIRNA